MLKSLHPGKSLLGLVLSAALPFAVLGQTNVVTQHNDIGRTGQNLVGSSRVDLQACKLEYSIVSPK